MATIRRREGRDGKVTYRVMARLKGHAPESATFERRTDAKRWATQTEAAIREGRHFAGAEARRHTVADLIDRYARDVPPAKKPSTRVTQELQLAWGREHICDRTLAECTAALVAEYRDVLAEVPIPSSAKDPEKAAPRGFVPRQR